MDETKNRTTGLTHHANGDMTVVSTHNRALLYLDSEHRTATFDADIRIVGDPHVGFEMTSTFTDAKWWSAGDPEPGSLVMDHIIYDLSTLLSDMQARIVAGDPNRDFNLDDYRITA